MKIFTINSGFNRSIRNAITEKTLVISGRKSGGKVSWKELLNGFLDRRIIFSEDLGITGGDISNKLNQLEPHSEVFLSPGEYEISNLSNLIHIITPDLFLDTRGASYQVFSYMQAFEILGRPFLGTYIKLGEVTGQLLASGGVYDISNASFLTNAPCIFERCNLLITEPGLSTNYGSSQLILYSDLFLTGTFELDLSWVNVFESNIVGEIIGLKLGCFDRSRFITHLDSPSVFEVYGVDLEDLSLPRTNNFTIGYYAFIHGNLSLVSNTDWATINFTDAYPIFINSIVSYQNLELNVGGFSEGYIGEITLAHGGIVSINIGEDAYLKIGKLRNIDDYMISGGGQVIIEG